MLDKLRARAVQSLEETFMRFEQLPAVSGGGKIGQAEEFRHHRLEFLSRIARECGDLGTFRLYFRTFVFVNSPELVHQVLVEKARCFEKDLGVQMLLYPVLGEGLFTSEGDLW